MILVNSVVDYYAMVIEDIKQEQFQVKHVKDGAHSHHTHMKIHLPINQVKV